VPRLSRENTLPSFALALEHGAEGLELDVHATSDGEVVVHHDPTLPDGTPIADLTRSQLDVYEPAPGVRVPSLSELCAAVADQAVLFVEIKGAGIEGSVAAVLANYTGRAAAHSFDHAMIARLHALAPELRLGILFDDSISGLADAMAATGALDVWPHYSLVSPSVVEAVHAAGGRVIPWTVNDPGVAERLAAQGVDGLCGDDVRIFPRRDGLAAPVGEP
jgi:glycerophosphoryl diester phosphodiesterase